MAQLGSVVVGGLVGRPGVVDNHALRLLAGSWAGSAVDCRLVRVMDFLSEVRLDSSADLIVWHGTDGSQIVTPIARLLDGVTSTLVLGGAVPTLSPSWTEPVLLRSTSVPDDGELEIVAAVAMTFPQFIGGDR